MLRSLDAEARSETMAVRWTLTPVGSVSLAQWHDVATLQGNRALLYLRARYGRSGTSIAMGFNGKELVAILWVVPSAVIRGAYSFVKEGSAIIACVTAADFRGRGIYIEGIRYIAMSGHSDRYYIWAHLENLPSLKGIRRAGGELVGSFTRVRWFGAFSRVTFRACHDNG